jgi:hypothetical protein
MVKLVKRHVNGYVKNWVIYLAKLYIRYFGVNLIYLNSKNVEAEE